MYIIDDNDNDNNNDGDDDELTKDQFMELVGKGLFANPEGIPEQVVQNYKMIIAAGQDGKLAVLPATLKETGETIYTLNGMIVEDNGVGIMPLAVIPDTQLAELIDMPGTKPGVAIDSSNCPCPECVKAREEGKEGTNQ
jgi:hypothetical protein